MRRRCHCLIYGHNDNFQACGAGERGNVQYVEGPTADCWGVFAAIVFVQRLRFPALHCLGKSRSIAWVTGFDGQYHGAQRPDPGSSDKRR